jgi:hypothetical protein
MCSLQASADSNFREQKNDVWEAGISTEYVLRFYHYTDCAGEAQQQM